VAEKSKFAIWRKAAMSLDGQITIGQTVQPILVQAKSSFPEGQRNRPAKPLFESHCRSAMTVLVKK
jgi:hypothetical protein